MMKTLYIALLGVAVATACRRSEIQQEEQGGTLQVEIARQAFDDPDSLATPASKATETAFEPADSIGIYVHTAAKLTAVGNHTPNLLYSTADGTTWTAGGYLSDLPQAGTTYTATGYYPYDRLMVDPTAFVFTVRGNQTTAKAVAQSELMYAAPTAIATPTSSPKLALSFRHLFTKITLKFAIPPAIDGAVVTAVDRVDLRGVYRAATVNLADGTLSKPDNQGDVTMHLIAGDPTTVGSEITYEAVVLPQTIKKGALLAELSFQTASGARKFTYRPDADEVWVSNLKRNLHLVSVGDLCFASRLDLTDGLAHADLALKIKAPVGAWTLTSPAAWLTLSATAGGTYGASISGTSTGVEQTVFVSVTANTSASGVSWLPRSGVLTLTSGALATQYTATQNFYRFGLGTAAFDASAGQSTFAVAPFVSNQEWKATGSGDWLKISPSSQFGAGDPKQEYTGGGSVGANGLFVHIDANNTDAAREGTVTFTPATAGGTASVTTIKQPVALCELSPEAVGVSKYVSTATPLFTVTVPRGVRWKLVSVVSGGVSDMNLSVVPSVGAEQVGTGEPQQVVGSYTELVGDAVRWSDVLVAWASYGNDQQQVVRVTQNLEAVLVDNIWWATGNLVATGAQGAAGKGGCAIGAPSDGGLYFQFGSLIGYKGGNLASGGTGVGIPDGAMQTDGKYWNGSSSYSWANEAMVWPSELVGTKGSWSNTTGSNISTLSDYYFNYSAVPWADMGRDLSSFSISGNSGSGTWQSGRYAKQGVGDPCRYYLGNAWRLSSVAEWGDLFQNKYANGTVGGSWPGANQNWGSPQANNQRIGTMASSSYTNDANSPTVGRGIYANTAATTGAAAAADANALFFPASGYRYSSNGSFYHVGRYGYGWSSAVTSATDGFYLSFSTTNIYPQNTSTRSLGFSVRCVAEFVDTKAWTAPVAGASKTVNVFVPKGIAWTASVIKGEGLTIAGGAGAGAGSFTITYAATAANSSRGGTIHVKSGSTVFVLKVAQTDQAVEVNGSWWATGNLVAASSTTGKAGEGGCKIGAPGDGGLYFQFGSLIGYKGGSTGTGTGIPSKGDGTYWTGGSYTWAGEAQVWPMELVGTKTSWSNTTGSGITTLSDYYFNYSSGWETAEQDIRSFNVSIPGDSGSGTLASGRYATKGVGDPCTYYLGDTWRLPTGAEYAAMCNNQSAINTNYSWAQVGGSWVTSPVAGGNLQGTKLFFPASGGRANSNGSFYNVTTYGYGWSSSVNNATYGLALAFYSSWVYPQNYPNRSLGFPVRCVMDL